MTGHSLTLDDFDDIQELDELAKKITDPADGIDSPLTQHVVYVRGVPVYPLTLAHLTYIDCCCDVLGITEDDRVTVLLWICTYSRVTDELYDTADAPKRYRKWLRHCQWTEQNMEAVIQLRFAKLLRDSDGSDDESNESALIGLLSREYGGAPDYWMYKAPIGVIEACVADWQTRQESQAAAYRRATKGAAIAPAPSPKFVAMRKFREYAERLEAKWLAKNHS